MRRRKPVLKIGAQGDQAEEIAAVQGQIYDAPLLDHGSYRGILRTEQRGGAADLDGLRGLSHRQCEVNASRLLHLKLDVGLHHGLETRRGGFHVIDAGRQARKTIHPGAIGNGRARDVGLDIGRRDGRIGQAGAAGIFDFSGNLTYGLGRRGSEQRVQESRKEQ